MDQYFQKIFKLARFMGAIYGTVLLGLPAIAMPWMTSPQLQGNSHIFNPPPDNRSRIPPESVVQLPLSVEQEPPSATITPVNGKVNIKLVNQTGAIINYQVIGDTNQRVLPGKFNVTLTNLKTPITLTFQRQDHGLLNVSAQPSNQPGTLAVTFTQTINLDTDKSAMTIQVNGEVFLN